MKNEKKNSKRKSSQFPQQQQKSRDLSSIKKNQFPQQQQNWEYWKKKLLINEDKKTKSLSHLNKLFMTKLEQSASKICLFYQIITLKIMKNEGNFIRREEIFDNLKHLDRGTIYGYIDWNIHYEFLIKSSARPKDYIITKNLQKLLKANVQRIMEKCERANKK